MAKNNIINTPEPFAIAAGGTGVASVTIAPTVSAWAGWDANKNLSANNLLNGYTTTATAASTTTLTVGSTYQQFFSGSTTQTVLLPVTSTLVLGQGFFIVNNSSGIVTVQSSGGNTIQAMASGTTLFVSCILLTGTTASSWYAEYTSQTSGANFPVNTNISSMTGLTGYLQAPLGIKDANGNIEIAFGSSASAVNYVGFTNSASTSSPIISAQGTDAAIVLTLASKDSTVDIIDSTATIGGVLRIRNAANTHGTSLTVATAQSTDLTLALPSVDGTNHQVMQTNGSGVLTLGNINAAILPSGTMFNFQQGQLTTPVGISPAGTWTDITGLNITITPTSSSNTVLVRTVFVASVSTNTDFPMFRLVRGSTPIGIGTSTGSRTPCGATWYINVNSGSDVIPVVMEWLDSPATTSATTYKVQGFTATTTTISIGNTVVDTNVSAFPRAVSTISVCEIHA
jgi:hypothetical protein